MGAARDVFADLDWLAGRIRVHGQRVEIGDSYREPKFFDRGKGRWVPQRVDYDAGVRVELLGVRAWVMSKEKLVRYKLALGREVDLEDVEQIAKHEDRVSSHLALHQLRYCWRIH